MSLTQIYTCDNCGHAQTCPQNRGDDLTRYMYDVKITLEGYQFAHHLTTPHHVLYCENCVEKFSLRRPMHRAQIEDKPPTLDDVVRQIVKDEMKNSE